MTSTERWAAPNDRPDGGIRPPAAAYVDRVEDDVVLVMGGEDHRTITIWRTHDRTRWVLTDRADDVTDRRTLGGAINAALRLLDVDPHDPSIERDDERS